MAMSRAQRFALMDIMDAQRFDMSKRSPLCCRLGLQLSESTGPAGAGGLKSPPPSPSECQPASPRLRGISNHYARLLVPLRTISLPIVSSTEDVPSPTASSDSESSNSARSTRALVSTSSEPPSPDDDASQNYQTDVHDAGEFTVTRTIIRPTFQRPGSGFVSPFSRPSSPFSHPSSPTSSRPSSPVSLTEGSLGCLSASLNFELDLETMLQKEQTQPPGGIAVLVTQEVSVEQEDPWTGAPQDTLDGQNENYDTASQSEGWQAQQGV